MMTKTARNLSTLLLIPLLWGCEALSYDLDEVDFVPNSDMATADLPATDMPATDMPATDMPATDMPVTDMPVTDMPATDMPVTDMPADMSMADMSADMPEDMGPPENVCVIGGELFGVCDPVGQNCSEGVCDLFFIAAEGRLESRCNSDPTDPYILPLGSACAGPSAADKCLAGLNCLVGGTCRKTCDRLTGAGCDSNEFCKTFEPTLSTGYCAPSC